MKRLGGLVLVTLLAACETAPPGPVGPTPTVEGYEANLKSWVGAPEAHLIRQWGPPQSSYTAGATKFITYTRVHREVVPGYGPTYTTRRMGNTLRTTPVGGQPDAVFDFHCTTTFEIEAEAIVAWSYRGNYCVAVRTVP